MELVVVNGASNIARSVIRGLTKQGAYSKVRLLDFRPYKSSVYAFQREMAAQGIEVEKHQTNSGQTLDIALEGADNVLYFTHNYTSMTSGKNDFLVGAVKAAKKHGVKSITAVCPVENDLAYTEDHHKSWTELRKEAEAKALDSNDKLTILNTDLVYGKDPTHLVHYMAQCAIAGKIYQEFQSDVARFNPVHHDDLAHAVKHSLESPRPGQFAVRGDEETSMKHLLELVERSCDMPLDNTRGKRNLIPFLGLSSMIEEFFVGITHDRSMQFMLQHFAEHPEECPVPGQSFWEASGLTPEHKLSMFFQYHRYHSDDEKMATPTFGHYKSVDLN